MSIAIPIIFYIVAFAAIITFQVLTFKKDRKLFLILALVTGFISSIISMIMTTYYGTVIDRLRNESSMMALEAASQIPTYQQYTIICLAASILLFSSIFLTGIVVLLKKLYLERR